MNKSKIILPSKYNNYLNKAIAIPKVFSAEECSKIINFSGDFIGSIIKTIDDSNKHYSPDARNSYSKSIYPNLETAWFFKKMNKIIDEVNMNTFNFILDSIQDTHILKYEEGGFFKKHVDVGDGLLSTRKLSSVLLLSATSDYEGGELEFDCQNHELNKEQGSIVFFPAYLAHVVKPVKRGVRYTFVGWSHGPSFK